MLSSVRGAASGPNLLAIFCYWLVTRGCGLAACVWCSTWQTCLRVGYCNIIVLAAGLIVWHCYIETYLGAMWRAPMTPHLKHQLILVFLPAPCALWELLALAAWPADGALLAPLPGLGVVPHAWWWWLVIAVLLVTWGCSVILVLKF